MAIDGKVYPVPRQSTYQWAQPQPPNVALGGITGVLIDGDLEDRLHTVDVIVAGNPVNNNRLSLYGFYLDRRNYRDPVRSLVSLVPVAVPVAPTAAATISLAPESLNPPASTSGPDRTFQRGPSAVHRNCWHVR